MNRVTVEKKTYTVNVYSTGASSSAGGFGWNYIVTGERVVVPARRQMVIAGEIINEGELIAVGDVAVF